MTSDFANGPLGNPPRLANGSTVPLSPGFISGDFLFLSGQLAFDEEGKIRETGIAEQTTRCLSTIDNLLKAAGLTRESVIKSTIWLTDAADFAGFNSAYAAFFGDHRPARSTVCAELLIPGAKVEIEVIAQRKPEDKSDE